MKHKITHRTVVLLISLCLGIAVWIWWALILDVFPSHFICQYLRNILYTLCFSMLSRVRWMIGHPTRHNIRAIPFTCTTFIVPPKKKKKNKDNNNHIMIVIIIIEYTQKELGLGRKSSSNLRLNLYVQYRIHTIYRVPYARFPCMYYYYFFVKGSIGLSHIKAYSIALHTYIVHYAIRTHPP